MHVMPFAKTPDEWYDPDLAAKWEKIRDVRSVITGALEIERQVKKTIGSALEAAPEVYVSDPDYLPPSQASTSPRFRSPPMPA